MARGIVPFAGDVKAAQDLAGKAGLGRSTFHAKGVFSEFPAATPKWVRNVGQRETDFRETMARLFIQVPQNELTRYIAAVEQHAHDQGETKILASVLAGSGDSSRGTGYIDFLLQQASHPFQEKTSIIETLGDTYVQYFFGQAAVPFSYSGVVLNTQEDDQAINLLRMYQNMMRGTQLSRRNKLIRFRYNGMIVAGAMMNLQLDLDGDSETYMRFSFNIMPKSLTLLPSPDFGVVILKEAAADPSFQGASSNSTAVKAQAPSGAPANILSGAVDEANEPTVEENEASQSLVTGSGTTDELDQTNEPLDFIEDDDTVPLPSP